MAYTKSNTTNVFFTDASASQVLSTKAKEIILSATTDCYISFDSTAVAASNGFFIAKDKQYIIHILFPAQISVIRKTVDGVLSVLELGDSLKELRVTYSDTFTGDTNLVGEVIGTFASDADLKGEKATTFTGDACTAEIKSGTFAGDASLKSIIAATFTGDINLRAIVAVTFTGDANLEETIHPLCFNGDAKLVTF